MIFGYSGLYGSSYHLTAAQNSNIWRQAGRQSKKFIARTATMNKQFLSLSSFRPRICFALAAILSTFIATTGCGSSEPVAVESSTTVTPNFAATRTETVTAANESQAESPAKTSVKLPEVDASPERVCEIFMQQLNRGERVKAERLLSSTALSTTAKAGLYLQPIGGKDAKVEIKSAVYATNKQRLAQVECVITEVDNGKEITDQLTWLVRKSKSGWRILGFMLRDDDGVEDFLSFENVRDVDAILQMSQASPAAIPDRQADKELSSEKRLN